MKHLYSLNLTALLCLFSIAGFAREISLQKPAITATRPLSFIENKGQVTDQHGKPRTDIDIKLDAGGVSVFVGDGAIYYQWANVKGKRENVKDPASGIQHQVSSILTYRMDVVLVGANKNAVMVKEEMQPYYENYYQPQLGEDGALVHSYNRITYKNVYPHIDWVLYTKNNELKYDFVVNPGGNAADIRLQYLGATNLQLKDGALTATTPMGCITEAAPYSYDAITKAAIKSSYKLEGNVLQFDIHNTANGIVIDPILKWATYYGSAVSDHVQGITTDIANMPYIAGITDGGNNMATTGAHQQTFAGTRDVFIAKFDETGLRLWGTYYGGSNQDHVSNIIADKAGNVYIGGETNSTSGIATTGAHQSTANFSGTNSVGMLVKFNSGGQRIWGTYYGNSIVGSDAVNIRSLACDNNNNIIIAGTVVNSATSNAIASPGAWQTTPGGSFVAKFNSSGVRQWGTYYGAPLVLDFHWVSCDGWGNIYLGGRAIQTGMATPGSHQPVHAGGYDGFLVKFSSGGIPGWFTYYGGTDEDIIEEVHVDPTGNVFVAGNTASTSAIASTGAYQVLKQAGKDAFIARFDTAGVRQWGTYYGGTLNDFPARITSSPDGQLYLAFSNFSPGMATPGSHQSTPSLGAMAIMSLTGQITYHTYYGGNSTWATTVHCSANGNIYLGGASANTTGISTPGSHQTAFAGGLGHDGFVALFAGDTAVYIQDVTNLTTLCPGDSLKAAYGVTQSFRPGNVFTLQLSGSTGSFASPTTLATKATQFGDTFRLITPTIAVGTGYRLRIVASLPALTSPDNGININISTPPVKPIASAGPGCTGQLLNLYSSPTPAPGVTISWIGPNSFTSNLQNATISNPGIGATGDYIVIADNNGCKRKDTVAVNIGQTPAKPTGSNNTPICTGGILNLFANSATPGVSYVWAGPNSFTSTLQNPVIDPAQVAAGGKYAVHAVLNGCNSENDTTLAVVNTVTYLGAYASPNDTVCQGQVVTVVTVPINGGMSPQFQWFKNNTLIPGATNLTYPTTTAVTGDSFYCRMIAGNVCNTTITLYSDKIGITVYPKTPAPTVSISSNPAKPLPGNAVTFTATAVNGGSNPGYQWLRNGVDVVGATLNTWGANNLTPYDKISVKLTSSERCPDTAIAISNVIEVNFPVSVSTINGNGAIGLYPNPNDGNFTLKGKTATNDILSIEIVNAIGQAVHTEKLQPVNNHISHTLQLHKQLAAGVYLLKVEGAVLRFVVE